MAKKSNKKIKEQFISTLVIFVILIIIVMLERKGIINFEKLRNYVSGVEFSEESIDNTSAEVAGDIIKIYFFDVGQADSMLITSNGESMLIDAGNNIDGKTVVKNIQKLGITKLDYVIGTHPHSDHIGGLDDVIKAFDIGTVYMPKVQTNTKTFEEVLDAISDKKKKVTTPEIGTKFNMGDISCEVMLDGTGNEEEQKENLNLSSVVIRATYGEQSYLFMADAEEINEASRQWPQTNVLKVGHHGSSSSSSQRFLEQVKPEVAIIQLGKDNDYFHPHKQVLNRLNRIGAKIYRTDENGTITITSDGINNIIETEK